MDIPVELSASAQLDPLTVVELSACAQLDPLNYWIYQSSCPLRTTIFELRALQLASYPLRDVNPDLRENSPFYYYTIRE